MTVAPFDTLKCANALKAVGVPDKQAEATIFAEAFSVNLKELATKDDLKQAMDLLRAEINGQFTLLKWMVGVSFTLSLATLALLGRLLFKMP